MHIGFDLSLLIYGYHDYTFYEKPVHNCTTQKSSSLVTLLPSLITSFPTPCAELAGSNNAVYNMYILYIILYVICTSCEGNAMG